MKGSNNGWLLPPNSLFLAEDEVHLWLATIDPSQEKIRSLSWLLSTDETERAKGILLDKDRWLYVGAHAALRLILSQYVNEEPEELQFAANEFGKPRLVMRNHQQLAFNMAHSVEHTLVAVSRGRSVGVDVEFVRPISDLDKVARRFFSHQERRDYQLLPSRSRTAGFFNCWTRKEAYIKAKGKGLALPLNQFTVSLIPGQEAKIIQYEDDPLDKRTWELRSVELEGDYIGAVVAEGQGWHLKTWHAAGLLSNLIVSLPH